MTTTWQWWTKRQGLTGHDLAWCRAQWAELQNLDLRYRRTWPRWVGRDWPSVDLPCTIAMPALARFESRTHCNERRLHRCSIWFSGNCGPMRGGNGGLRCIQCGPARTRAQLHKRLYPRRRLRRETGRCLSVWPLNRTSCGSHCPCTPSPWELNNNKMRII